jgi:hypothetical protein
VAQSWDRLSGAILRSLQKAPKLGRNRENGFGSFI